MTFNFNRSCVAALIAVFLASPTCVAKLKSTKVPRYDAAVAKAVGHLQSLKIEKEADFALAAYALLKAGVDQEDKMVASGIEAAKERSSNGSYRGLGYDHIYMSGVDAMLLADSDEDAHFDHLQKIATYVQSAQRSDGSWSDTGPRSPGDVSMTQYGVLALWAAKRAGCNVAASSLDNAAAWLVNTGNQDGGWGYRPGTKEGPGKGSSTSNMTMAAAGSVAVARTLLHGPKGGKKKKDKAPPKFGVLEVVESEAAKAAASGKAFPEYTARMNAGSMDSRVDRAFGWNGRFSPPVSRAEHKIYFYYALERAAALADLPEGWFTTYGDGLLSLQGKDGAFNTFSGPANGTSLAILYFMRSTQQIIDKQYGTGVQAGGRGLDGLFGAKDKKKKELGPLDELLGELEKADLSQLDNMDEIVEKVQYGSKEELIGQVDKLKLLLKSPEAAHRQTAYFALGRTGDFDLIPEVLQGLRDRNLDVNVEALRALRYISRKPNGFGVSDDPLAGPAFNSEEQKLVRANNWRSKAYRAWADWYRRVRPYEEGGGLDELELLGPSVSR